MIDLNILKSYTQSESDDFKFTTINTDVNFYTGRAGTEVPSGMTLDLSETWFKDSSGNIISSWNI